MQAMASRSVRVSLLILAAVFVVAAVMYVVIGNQGGWVGVPKILAPDVAQGTSGNLLYTLGWGLLIVLLFTAFGYAVYKMRGLTD